MLNTPGPGITQSHISSPYTTPYPQKSPGYFATPMNREYTPEISHRSPFYPNTPLMPQDPYQVSPGDSISG